MNILINATLDESFIQQIKAMSPEISLVNNGNEGALTADLLKDAEVLYSLAADFPMEAAPNLKWLQMNSAAVNQLAGLPILQSDVVVTNVSGAYTTAVAECAMAMLLGMARRLPLGFALQGRREWDSYVMQGYDLYGKTLGIVGYGSIGRHIGRLAHGFGMKILACKRQPEERRDTGFALPGTGDAEGGLPEAWYGVDEIEKMCALSDILVITLPLTDHTRNIIGRAELAALPAGAFVINVGRGGVLNEAALLELLKSGHIAAAALDVFENEPLPADSPMWDAPNLMVLPHIASWTVSQPERAAAIFIENVKRYVTGEPLLNVVDKQWLY